MIVESENIDYFNNNPEAPEGQHDHVDMIEWSSPSDTDKCEASPRKKSKSCSWYKQKSRDLWKESFDFIENKHGCTWCRVCNINIRGGVAT